MIPEKNLKYVFDTEGNKEAVIISIEDWMQLNEKISELSEYQLFKESLGAALNEVKKIKEGSTKKVSLKQFLNEV